MTSANTNAYTDCFEPGPDAAACILERGHFGQHVGTDSKGVIVRYDGDQDAIPIQRVGPRELSLMRGSFDLPTFWTVERDDAGPKMGETVDLSDLGEQELTQLEDDLYALAAHVDREKQWLSREIAAARQRLREAAA